MCWRGKGGGLHRRRTAAACWSKRTEQRSREVTERRRERVRRYRSGTATTEN